MAFYIWIKTSDENLSEYFFKVNFSPYFCFKEQSLFKKKLK